MAVGEGGFRQRSISDKPNPGLLNSINKLGYATSSTMTVVEIPWDNAEIMQMKGFGALPDDFEAHAIDPKIPGQQGHHRAWQ